MVDIGFSVIAVGVILLVAIIFVVRNIKKNDEM
jgi:hypothetical protein